MDFSQWILSIVGVVMLTLIVDIVLPEGETNKYIKSIFAIVTVFIIVSPLPRLINGDIKIDTVFQFEEVRLDENYINSLNDAKVLAIESDCEIRLANEGYKNVDIQIISEQVNFSVKVKKISANIDNLVIDNSLLNIFSVDKLVGTICNITGVEKENITINGGN